MILRTSAKKKLAYHRCTTATLRRHSKGARQDLSVALTNVVRQAAKFRGRSSLYLCRTFAPIYLNESSRNVDCVVRQAERKRLNHFTNFAINSFSSQSTLGHRMSSENWDWTWSIKSVAKSAEYTNENRPRSYMIQRMIQPFHLRQI